MMKCWRLNLVDENGNIVSGYQDEIVDENLKDAIEDYLYYLELEGHEVDASRVDVEELPGEWVEVLLTNGDTIPGKVVHDPEGKCVEWQCPVCGHDCHYYIDEWHLTNQHFEDDYCQHLLSV